MVACAWWMPPRVIISTFAGNGTPGYSGDGGKASNASLNSPAGLVADKAGNIYISDYGNATVRKVDTSGNITTVAGTGTWGYSGDGGPANKAALAHPVALAIDTAGNIYIADPGNLNIREITTDGNIHTVVSNLDAESIAVDAAGSIYYPNYLNSTIQKILSNGTQFTIAGNGTVGFSGDGGPATAAQLNSPYGVAVDSSGNVYVADFANMAIRQLTPGCFHGHGRQRREWCRPCDFTRRNHLALRCGPRSAGACHPAAGQERILRYSTRGHDRQLQRRQCAAHLYLRLTDQRHRAI